MMNKYPNPATLYGTVLKCETKLSNANKQYKQISLSLYCGKNQDGTYKPNIYVQIMYFGNKTFTVRNRYTFSGILEIKLIEKDGKNYINNSMMCFDQDDNVVNPDTTTAESVPF